MGKIIPKSGKLCEVCFSLIYRVNEDISFPLLHPLSQNVFGEVAADGTRPTPHNLWGRVQNENAGHLDKKKKYREFQDGNSGAVNQNQGPSERGAPCDCTGLGAGPGKEL